MTDQPSFGRAGLTAPEAELGWSEGAGIIEAVTGVADGASTGDLFGVTANGAVVVLSGLAAVTDPFQVTSSTSRWSSLAVSAYRGRAKDHAETVQALGVAADRLAKLTLIAGAMVGVVRNTIRDLIAEVVGAPISKAVQAVAVVTIPKVRERHGPVGNGFGYWDECTARVLWDNGQTATIAIDKRGFFTAADIGKTVTIGYLGIHKGSDVFARKELPSRPLVAFVCVILVLIAVAPLMLLLYVAWARLRHGVRRLVGR